jgi:tetraacyldisaccharide 4'-kinase
MREPAFWWEPASSQLSWQSRLLKPVGAVYGLISGRRMMREGVRAKAPVICVGNFHVGGAGKTPTVIALVNLLKRLDQTPCVLSRGYGGSLAGPVRVEPAIHRAEQVGDEPLLIARHAPVIVSRNRVAGAEAAVSAGASVIVMDDGFQNPSLRKDLSIVVIDAGRGVGNGAVFPAGPLRAPLPVQLPRADVLLVIGAGRAADAAASNIRERGGYVFHARITPRADAVAGLAGKRVLAFAGIGDPKRFFRTLRAAGIDVASTRAYADHHPYTRAEINDLAQDAQRSGLSLVTTEKDMMRLAHLDDAVARQIKTLPIALEIDDSEELQKLVQRALSR